MTEKFKKKNIKLVFEFNSYVFANPQRMRRLPDKSTVFVTVKGDESFNKQSRSLAEMMKTRKYNKIVEARKEGRTWKILSPATA